MAATIKIKNSSTAGAAPTSSDLVQGELAVNVTDKRLYTENASGTIVELGTNPSVPVTFPDGSASAPSLTNDGDTNTGLFFPAADTVGITTGGTERVRVDSSGNLGLGVTPSASSNLTNIEMPQGVQIGARKLSGYPQMYLSSNVSGDAYSPTYKINGYATQYRLESSAGKHEWYTAASGTAGNAITFTQAMTLDASGYLLIGATSRSGYNEQVLISSPATVGQLALNSASGYNSSISHYINNSAKWYTQALGDGSGAYRWYDATAGAERARIDSSGNLLVGQTSLNGAGKVEISYDRASSWGMQIRNTTGTTAATTYIAFKYVNTQTGYIESSGSTTSYVTTSDYRLKENIVPMTGALAKVALLKPCTYTWKTGGAAGEGFIAHELQEVCPSAVSGEKDAVNEDGSIKPQGIDTSFLVATLTAAIQEQQAIIESLTARITALEA